MIISHSHRFVFIHNPKVGGTSIRKLLEPYAERNDYHARGCIDGIVYDTSHLPVMSWTPELVKAYKAGYYFFGIVKNPMDRFRSALSEILFQTPDFVLQWRRSKTEDFVSDVLSKDSVKFDARFVHFTHQWSYFCLPPSVALGESRPFPLRGIQIFNLPDLYKEEGEEGSSAWNELWSKIDPSIEPPPFKNLRPSFYKPSTLKLRTMDTIYQVYEEDYQFLSDLGFIRWPSTTEDVDMIVPTEDSLSTTRLDFIARNGDLGGRVPKMNLREKNADERFFTVGSSNSMAYHMLREELLKRKD